MCTCLPRSPAVGILLRRLSLHRDPLTTMLSLPYMVTRLVKTLAVLSAVAVFTVAGLTAWNHMHHVSGLQLEFTRLKVTVVLKGLEIPWDMDWSSDGWIWFSEKAGRISRVQPDSGVLQTVHFIPDVYQSLDNSGLHALALAPGFPESPYVYAHYTYSAENSRLVRFRFDPVKISLEDATVLLDALPAGRTHNGSRIVFSHDGQTMFFSIGDATRPDLAQSLDVYAGKVLRLRLDGGIPRDNPFPGSLVWSYGHRNPQGLVMGPNGILYSSEHGRALNDELNLIEKGHNYGYPNVRGFCDLEEEQDFCAQTRVHEPMITWSPTIGVAGIAFYDSEAIPEWRNSILVTALKSGRDPFKGKRLIQVQLDHSGTSVANVNNYLEGEFGRLREVMVDPAGRVFLFTSNRELNANRPRLINLGDDKLIMLSIADSPRTTRFKSD